MSGTLDVSVVIPTFNAGAQLNRLLDAIAAQDGPYRPVVVAIDSGSTDGTTDLLRARGARVLTISQADFNHGATRNRALEVVTTEFAVMTVQDALPASAAWLHALVSPLSSDGSLAGTWARQQPRPDASRITAYYLSRWAAAQESPRTAGPITREQFAALTPAQRHLACAFDNVCACIRMSVWREHPFATTRIAEDLEWAQTVLQAGHRLAFVPAAAVVHSHDRPAAYELRRTYLVHERLQALFGLTTIPDLGGLARAIAVSLALHVRLAAGEPRGRLRALVRAIQLAVVWPLGQYLGALAARQGRDVMEVRGV